MADDGVWAVYGGMKALFDARKPAEHIFLLSIDFLNFKLVNHLYGSVRGTEPLGAVADLLDRLPGVLLWIGSMLTDSRFWCAARKRILSRPTAVCREISGRTTGNLSGLQPAPFICWRTEMF